MIDIWLPCCHLAGGAYYWQQIGMFGILLSCLCFASYKYSHHSIHLATSFGHTFSATTNFQFVSGRVCIMAITRAGAITAAAKAVSKSRENEKRRKSAARTCKWRECQSKERLSKIRQSDLMGHAEGCACLSEEQRSEIGRPIWRGMQHAEGHVCLSEKQRSKKRQTDWTWHAEGRACLSVEWRSEIRQTNWTGHAEGRARLSEEQHAENGAHLSLLILYLLSLITLQDKELKEDPVIYFHMLCTTASWQHCCKAKEVDSQVGKEFWRQDKSLKDMPRTL